jgi:hypothetical protein
LAQHLSAGTTGSTYHRRHLSLVQQVCATEGALFRPVPGEVSAERLAPLGAFANVVKSNARRLGLNVSDFSAHSLRSGFLTSAARRGASVFKMRDVSRHKSVDVLQSYVRDAELFQDHAGAGLL